MSWSVTINDLEHFVDFDTQLIEDMMTQHIKYPRDMRRALEMARRTGLASCVLTGMRTPNPYGGDEVVDISIRGHMEALDFQAEMKRIMRAGPDEPTPE